MTFVRTFCAFFCLIFAVAAVAALGVDLSGGCSWTVSSANRYAGLSIGNGSIELISVRAPCARTPFGQTDGRMPFVLGYSPEAREWGSDLIGGRESAALVMVDTRTGTAGPVYRSRISSTIQSGRGAISRFPLSAVFMKTWVFSLVLLLPAVIRLTAEVRRRGLEHVTAEEMSIDPRRAPEAFPATGVAFG